MISKNEIEKYLTTTKLGRNLELFEEIDQSTNTYLEDKVDQGILIDGEAVIATLQHGGRGRVGRKWISGPMGKSLAISFALNTRMENEKIPRVTILAALAVCDAIKEFAGDIKSVKIKWPNDILIGDKKACGILSSLKTDNSSNTIIVGIGINLSQEDFPDEIKDTATSLKLENIEVDSREKFIAIIFNSFEKYFEMFSNDGLTNVIDRYNNMLAGKGEMVKVLDSNMKVILEGEIVCANNDGELLIKKSDDKIEKISSGEISIRGGFYGRE